MAARSPIVSWRKPLSSPPATPPTAKMKNVITAVPIPRNR